MKRLHRILFLLILTLTACAPAEPEPTVEPQATLTPIVIYVTATPQPTQTPSITPTPTIAITSTPSITPTPTISAPTMTANKQAHCRYGPSAAYLHAADLYAGDKGIVRYRAVYSSWLYVQFDKINYSCWVAPSVVDVVGDVGTLPRIEPDLQRIGSNMYGPPQNVQATRNGNEVLITWSQMKMTADDDRGYFFEGFVCQNGAYLWWTQDFPEQTITSFSIKDEAGCPAPSYGKLYTVEKHGYSLPVDIAWPPPP